MAFPTPGTATTETGTSLGSNNAQTLPSYSNGDLLLCFVHNDSTTIPTVGTGSATWATVYSAASASRGIAIFGRVTNGTDTLTLTGASEDYCVTIMPIADHGVTDPATDIEISTRADHGTGMPNAPSLDAGVSADWLWLAFGINDVGAGEGTWSTMPTSYTQVSALTSDTGGTGTAHSVAYRQNATQTEDPAIWATGWDDDGEALTLAVPPASSGDANVSATVVTATVSIPSPAASTPILGYIDLENADEFLLEDGTDRLTNESGAPAGGSDASVSPPVVTATVSVPAPSVSAGSTITATVVTATASVPAPTISTGDLITATVVTATADVPAPTVTAGTGASVTATVVTALASVPAPTVSVGSTVTATVVTATASVPAPSVSAGWTFPATVPALDETEIPSGASGDVADGPWIWRNRANPAASWLLGSNKSTGADGGVYTYGLDGALVDDWLIGAVNSIDGRDLGYSEYSNVVAGWAGRVLVVATERNASDLVFGFLNRTTGAITTCGTIAMPFEPYGCCLYVSASTGDVFAFVSEATGGSGGLRQYELTITGDTVTGSSVRTLDTATLSEGMATYEPDALFFLAEEDAGLYVYDAEPTGGTSRTTIDTTSGNLVADAEGISIAYPINSEPGYVICSSQGDSTYSIYELASPHDFVANFEVVANGGVDAVTNTDGIAVVREYLGPTWPDGLFVVHDDTNTTASNFKLVDAGDIFGPLNAGTPAYVNPTVVTATTSVPAPTVGAGVGVTATVVTAATSVPAPTASAGSSVTATVVTAAASVPAPTASAGSSLTATVVTASVSVPAPSVSTSGNASVSATVVTATASVPAPSVSTSANASVTATVVTATASVPTATATGSASVSASVVTATVSVPAPSVSTGGGVSISATVVTAAASVPAPTLALGAGVTANVVTAVASALAAIVQAGNVLLVITGRRNIVDLTDVRELADLTELRTVVDLTAPRTITET